MLVTQENNFCRIFELPLNYPEGFLFAGGKQVPFLLIDWFNPIPADDIWNKNVKPWSEYEKMLEEWLLKKVYVIPGRKYILITDFGKSLIFGK